MLRKRKIGRQNEYRIVLLEDLAPKEHLYLKNVETAVDFSFIHGHCKNLYCLDNGRTRDQSTFRLFTNLHGMDAGYHNAAIAHLLKAKGIQGLIGTDATHAREHYRKWRFLYDFRYDFYRCPEHPLLNWKTTTREGYRQYFCNPKVCADCLRRKECSSGKARGRW